MSAHTWHIISKFFWSKRSRIGFSPKFLDLFCASRGVGPWALSLCHPRSRHPRRTPQRMAVPTRGAPTPRHAPRPSRLHGPQESPSQQLQPTRQPRQPTRVAKRSRRSNWNPRAEEEEAAKNPKKYRPRRAQVQPRQRLLQPRLRLLQLHLQWRLKARVRRSLVHPCPLAPAHRPADRPRRLLTRSTATRRRLSY